MADCSPFWTGHVNTVEDLECPEQSGILWGFATYGVIGEDLDFMVYPETSNPIVYWGQNPEAIYGLPAGSTGTVDMTDSQTTGVTVEPYGDLPFVVIEVDSIPYYSVSPPAW